MARFRFPLRYSLRTLFVVVTAICLWFGYHINWIRERHAVLANMPFPGYTIPGYPPFHFPVGLRLLGEEEINSINLMVVDTEFSQDWNAGRILFGPHSQEQAERIKRLFPEAHVLIERLAEP